MAFLLVQQQRPSSSSKMLVLPTLPPPPPVALFLSSSDSQIPTEDTIHHHDFISSSIIPPSETIPKEKSLRVKLGLASSSLWEDEADDPATIVPATTTTMKPLSFSKVVGHRGSLYEYLENTREGFIRCAQLGCHAVELDVFVLTDGHVVVFHGSGSDENPGDVSEYCILQEGNNNNKRSILEMTYPETQALQFNPHFAEFVCDPDIIRQARIPLLQDVLQDLLPYPHVEIKIELKGPGVVRPVLDIVERMQMQHRCSYSSFHLEMLAELRTFRPDRWQYPTGALFTIPPTDYLERAMAVGATEIHLRYDQCHIDRIQSIHQAGFRSMAWLRGPIGMAHDTEHSYWDIQKEEGYECYRTLLETGVQQICCNKPHVLLELSLQVQIATTSNTQEPSQ